MTVREQRRKDLLAWPHLVWRADLVADTVAGLTCLLAGLRLTFLGLGDAGFDRLAMAEMMQILAEASPAGPPEFFSSKPSPENRIQRIEAAVHSLDPNGVPSGLIP